MRLMTSTEVTRPPSLSDFRARWTKRRRRRLTRQELMRCSDRVLADIGFKREHIPLIAKGIDPLEYRGNALQVWWHGLKQRLIAANLATRDRRRVHHQSTGYTDAERLQAQL